jgi:hypothetical protein
MLNLIQKSKEILDLAESDGFVEKSSINNAEIMSKDPISGNINFDWVDWSSYFKTSFKACLGVQKWHVVKIIEFSQDIQVADFLRDIFREIKIMNDTILRDRLDIILS